MLSCRAVRAALGFLALLCFLGLSFAFIPTAPTRAPQMRKIRSALPPPALADTGRPRLLLIGDSIDLEAANTWCYSNNGTRMELRLRGGAGVAVLTERNGNMRNAPPVLPWGTFERRVNTTLPLYYHCWWTVFCDAPAAHLVAMRYPFGSSGTGPYHDDGGCGGGNRPAWRDADDGPDWRGSADAVDAVAALPLPHDVAAIARAFITPMIDAATAMLGAPPHIATFSPLFWDLARIWTYEMGGRDPISHPSEYAFETDAEADAFAARWRGNATALASVFATHPEFSRGTPRTALAWRLSNTLRSSGCLGRKWWCGMIGVPQRIDAVLQAAPFPLPFIPFNELPYCTQNRDPVHPMPQCGLGYVNQLLAHAVAVRAGARNVSGFEWRLKAVNEEKV
jgi:hypothetical protein